MGESVIFFQPIFKEKIWGGGKLKNYGYDIPSDKTGEAWVFSAHPNGESIAKNGKYKGKTLGWLWENHREVFGELKGDKFPLLVKIIDANDDLSVQVHPDDSYALVNENGELGKSECWYILDCKEDADLIYGINAKDRVELEEMIDKGKWDELLRTIPISKGDFFFVPSGTVHAIKAGTVILEIQQNSDTTYRLYDYDRKDDSGNFRELNIEKSKAVIEVPFAEKKFKAQIKETKEMVETKLIESDYFSVTHYDIKDRVDLKQDQPFEFLSIIEGSGVLKIEDESFDIVKGDHLMLTSNVEAFSIEGKVELIKSSI